MLVHFAKQRHWGSGPVCILTDNHGLPAGSFGIPVRWYLAPTHDSRHIGGFVTGLAAGGVIHLIERRRMLESPA